MVVDEKVADSAMYKLFCSLNRIKREIGSGAGRCPKCGTRTMERDGADLHCWACGETIYNVFTSGNLTPNPKSSCGSVVEANVLIYD